MSCDNASISSLPVPEGMRRRLRDTAASVSEAVKPCETELLMPVFKKVSRITLLVAFSDTDSTASSQELPSGVQVLSPSSPQCGNMSTGNFPFVLQSVCYHSSSYLPKLEANFIGPLHTNFFDISGCAAALKSQPPGSLAASVNTICSSCHPC